MGNASIESQRLLRSSTELTKPSRKDCIRRTQLMQLKDLMNCSDTLLNWLWKTTHTPTSKFAKTLTRQRAQWGTLADIMKLEKDPKTTLQTHDGKFFFNEKDVTEEGGKMIEEYIKGEFRFLGYSLGKNMKDAAAPSNMFLH